MATELTKTFDYSGLDKESKGKLIWYAAEIRKQRTSHVEAGLNIGRMLSEAKELLNADVVFAEWVESEFGYSKSTAYNYISAHEQFRDFPNFGMIELSAMYVLTTNEAAKKKALKLAEKGVQVTHAKAKELVKAIVAKAKPEEVDEAPVPAVERTITPPEQTPEPKPESKAFVDYGKCPNCAGTKWIDDPFGVTCAKCNQPHGEPAGEVDAERITIARSKTVKTVEALQRAFDDLHSLSPRADHALAMGACKSLLQLARDWK